MSVWRHPQVLLLVLAIALLGVTFVAPKLRLERPTFRYVLVFDITQSMNVADVGPSEAPLTRLEYAKQLALDALKEMPCGTDIGLALFSGHRAFLMITPIELCANYAEISNMVASIDWRMTWEARSEVAKGVFRSVELLRQLKDPTRLVFLTDGHEAPPINPDVRPQFSGQLGEIGGLLVGVGGDAPVPIPKFDAQGKQQGYWRAEDVMQTDSFRADQNAREGRAPATGGSEQLSSLKENYLQGLAHQTGLTYLRLQEGGALSRALESRAFGIPTNQPTDIRWAFGLTALVALAASLMQLRQT